MNKPAVIHARLSSAQSGKEGDEQSDSIQNQVADLKKLAQAQGLTVAEVFSDDGVSGYSGKYRPAFSAMLAYIADNDVSYILSRHQDRLTRNEEEGLVLRVASIKTRTRWMFASGMTLDPSTAEGELMAKVLEALAVFESRIKTYRLLQHFDAKRMAGLIQASPGTFGYEKADLVPWEAELIREAYETMHKGGTVGSIVRAWNKAQVPQRKKGKHGWTYAHIRAILLRPRNAGLVADRDGNIIEGVVGEWDTIIDPQTWHEVRNLITNPARNVSPGFTPRHLSGGIAKCGLCGFRMSSNTVSDVRRGTRYTILRCANPHKEGVRHPSARVSDLDALMRTEIIKAFTFGPANLFQEEAGGVVEIQKEIGSYRQKRADILDLLELGVIAKSEAVERLKKWDEPISKAEARMEEAVSKSATAAMLSDLREGFIDPETKKASLKGAVALQEALGEKFDALEIEQRRQLARALLDVRVHGGRGSNKYEIQHTKVTSLNEEN